MKTREEIEEMLADCRIKAYESKELLNKYLYYINVLQWVLADNNTDEVD